MKRNLEHTLEKGLFASRWLMAPFYLGLVGALCVLLYTFGLELVHFIQAAPEMDANDAILASLALIGITRAVTYSSQETAQSATNIASQVDRFVYTIECMFPFMM